MNTSISICTVRGQTARVGTNPGNFTIPDVPVCAGDNDLQVTARAMSGNTAPQTRSVSRLMDETFRYDGNGNLTNWVSGTTNWVYEWDWANRLTKVSSNGVTVLENWYDAGSRRLAKKDAAYALYLWDGWESVAVLNQSGVAQEIFTRGVGIVEDIGTLVAITKLSTPAIYYAHHNHRGDVTTVRSGASTVSGYSYSAFGLQTSAFGTDVSRFKFSSKERESSCNWSYYGYRFYAPQWQRWISDDLIGESGGINLFQFLASIPTVALDPNGLQIYYPPGVHDNTFWHNLGRCLGIANGRRSEYRGLVNSRRTREITDKWFHCATSCEVAGECGDSIATAFGNLHEWWNASVDNTDTSLDPMPYRNSTKPRLKLGRWHDA